MTSGYPPNNFTKLFLTSQVRAQKQYEHLRDVTLGSWRTLFHDNNRPFGETIVDCFWAGVSCEKAEAIRPAIEEAVREVFAATVKDCEKHSPVLEPRDCVNEVEMLLNTMVRQILRDMIEMDYYFRGEGYPGTVQSLPEEQARERLGVDQLARFIHERAEATTFLESNQDHSEEPETRDVREESREFPEDGRYKETFGGDLPKADSDVDAVADKKPDRQDKIVVSDYSESPRYTKGMTTKEIAGYFKVSASTVRRRINEGLLDAKPDGRKWRVLFSQLPIEEVKRIIKKLEDNS